ncbi:hypothetical protein E2I00_015787, partial [Balaenoptera physalus]
GRTPSHTCHQHLSLATRQPSLRTVTAPCTALCHVSAGRPHPAAHLPEGAAGDWWGPDPPIPTNPFWFPAAYSSVQHCAQLPRDRPAQPTGGSAGRREQPYHVCGRLRGQCTVALELLWAEYKGQRGRLSFSGPSCPGSLGSRFQEPFMARRSCQPYFGTGWPFPTWPFLA